MLTKNLFLTIALVYTQFFMVICQENPVISHKTLQESPTQQQIIISVDPGESWLYKDSVRFSVDHPDITLSAWQADREAINQYDTAYRKTKRVYQEPVQFTLQATAKTDQKPIDAHVHMAYELKGESPTEYRVPLAFSNTATSSINSAQENQAEQPQYAVPVSCPPQPFSFARYTAAFSGLSTRLSTILETTNSLPIRLLLVFLLGILLSLTPCIYPMIPITVGILQAQGGRSFWYNCVLALSYTCGLATTFACFGLAASCVGPLCGKLLMHPIFVLLIVALLVYLAFSLFDWYELYTPKFFKASTTTNPNGSLLSTFLFGAASGTFASPCVSPGLALLLTIVASLGNIFLGFLLLFVFGVGLSMPLLIVGIFSSSLSVMPKAGSWMVEIKKLFGFLLLAMCFYYLKNIIPWSILQWMISIFVFSTGTYYLYTASKTATAGLKKMHNVVGFILISWSVVLAAQSVQETLYGALEKQDSVWLYDYQAALTQARQENKLLFIDFWATYCSICLAINNKTLKHPSVVQALTKVVPLKVDGSYDTNTPFAQLKDKFNIQGFPVFLLVDPTTEKVVKRWGSELYTKPIDEFIKELA